MPAEGATMANVAGGHSLVGPMVPSRYRVTDRRQETADSVTISLMPMDDPIDDAEPGQFTMLYAFGVGEVPISVSGCPRHEGVLMHTIRAVGATSRALCNLEPGSVVGVRGPFGVGWDVPSAEGSDVLIVGGGIGLAPLRPGRARGARCTRAFRTGRRADRRSHARTTCSTRTRSSNGGRFPDVHVGVTVDAASPGWEGHVGLVTELLGQLPVTPSSTTSFLCGPEVMIRVVARNILKSGATADHIRVSLERNMHCAVRQCGHCQLGPLFVCADGPVVTWATAADLLAVRRW